MTPSRLVSSEGPLFMQEIFLDIKSADTLVGGKWLTE